MKLAMRSRVPLRRRPWKLIIAAVAFVGFLIWAIVDPLDGDVIGGGRHSVIHYTWAHQPVLFLITAAWHIAAGLFFAVLGSMAAYNDWNVDYLPPRRDPIDDPDFTSHP